MGAGAFIWASIVSGFIVAVGLPMAIGIFFRGFMKNANPNIPAFMAAAVMFGLQQVVVYRGDARITTVLPRIQSWLPESIRYETYTLIAITIVLIFAGTIIPFVFAKMGIRFADFMDRVTQKITDFFDRIFHRK